MKTSYRASSAKSSLGAVKTSFSKNQSITEEIRLYRLSDVLARIPVSRSSWFSGIQVGRYPRGHHLGPRTTVWRSDDIDRLIANLGGAA